MMVAYRGRGNSHIFRAYCACSLLMKTLRDKAVLLFYKLAASGLLPARWFAPDLPRQEQREARVGALQIEIVSHCWQYSHLLVYQLSSLILNPPRDVSVVMTVFHAPQDQHTVELLAFIAGHKVPNVTWNWQPLTPQQLFRRSIGRNQAALASSADWVWFTDCDLVFAPGCLDALGAALQGRQDALVYPRQEQVTTLLRADDPLLSADAQWSVREVGTSEFYSRDISRATGPLQITHGDVARAVGYCRDTPFFQRPEESFAKCHEDRVFRWLLGTQGTPIDLPGVCRIRHAEKGRYKKGAEAHVRGGLRQLREWGSGRG